MGTHFFTFFPHEQLRWIFLFLFFTMLLTQDNATINPQLRHPCAWTLILRLLSKLEEKGERSIWDWWVFQIKIKFVIPKEWVELLLFFQFKSCLERLVSREERNSSSKWIGSGKADNSAFPGGWESAFCYLREFIDLTTWDRWSLCIKIPGKVSPYFYPFVVV